MIPAERRGANSEAATIARGTAAELRAFFPPPGIAESELVLGEIERFRLHPPGQGSACAGRS